MGFNKRKMEADRKAKGDAEAAVRRATDAQVLDDAADEMREDYTRRVLGE